MRKIIGVHLKDKKFSYKPGERRQPREKPNCHPREMLIFGDIHMPAKGNGISMKDFQQICRGSV